MRKNYFSSFFNKNTLCIPKQSGILKNLTLAITFVVCFVYHNTSAQTTLVNPATVGGFETGTTFASNGWTAIMSATATRNSFTVNAGPLPSPFTPYGSRCAYVTNDRVLATPPFTYTNTAGRVTTCIYRDIVVPAGQSVVILNFNWKGVGESGFDRLRVWATPTTFTPTLGLPILATGGNVNIGLTEYVNQPAWAAVAPITLPTIINGVPIAGSTFRLIFEWDGIGIGVPTTPIAVDNIGVTSEFGFNDDCISARPLTVGAACTTVTYDSTGATDSAGVMSPPPPAPTCDLGYNGSDVWFSAIVGLDGTLTVTTSSAGGLTDPVMAAYTGTCGGAGLTQIACADDTVGNYPVIALTGQSPGATIYFRVWDWGATVDYGTFNICATAPTCFRPTVNATTAITPTTATINWSPNVAGAPSNGYQYIVSTSSTTPIIAGTAAAGVTANITGLNQNTTYYVFVRGFCGGTDFSAWSVAGTFTTTIPAPTTTGVNICQGGTGSVTASAVCTTATNLGGVINGTFNGVADPIAPRPATSIISTDPCSFSVSTSNYTAMTFTVDVSGSYVFYNIPPGADLMGYITTGPFTPGSCATGTWIAGDDDSGGIGTEPQITANLVSGTVYTLYTTGFGFGDVIVTGNYTWTVTGPGSIFSTTAGILQWWTAASGGSVIGTGTPFNPVGVAGSGVANNTTPVSTNFYAACSSFPNIRTAASYVINASPSSVISGTGSACASTTVSIALTGTSPWTFTYTDGVTPVTVTNQPTTPYTFAASPGVPTTYTVSALSNATCATTAAAYRTGSAVLYSKVWNGGTADWSNPSNWTPGVTVPSATDCVIITNAGTPPVISGTNYYAYANKLTVNNSAILTVNATNSLTVTNEVTVATTVPAGNIILNDDSSLVQVTNVLANNNTGNITFNRTASIRRTDYVYWSSPFAALNASLISPATNPYYIYKWNPSIANSNNGEGNWVNGNDSPMVIGKGYIIRAPDLHPTALTNFTTTVSGLPNNGAITTPVTRGTILGSLLGNNGITITAIDDNWNLVGNPYPSSIDAVAFLTQNANLDGNVRLWTHGTPIGNLSASFYNTYTWGYADSYLTYNISGPNPPGFGGKIASGQGFFVNVDEVSPTVAFNNTMRAYDYDNSEFFRTSSDNATQDTLERSRIWLSILNENVLNNSTTMVCYIDGATLEKDRMFDAPNRVTGNLNIYSLIGEQKMNIQGRPTPFDQADIVPLGYTADQNGIFRIGIAEVDGLFEDANQNIYLEDTLLGVIHDLRSNYYTFTTTAGTVDNRFNLRYSNTALGTSQEEINTFNYISNNVLNIKSTKNIESVDIYDIGGKLLKSCSSDGDQTFETDFNYPNGVYLLKIKLDNGMYVTKKQLK